MLKLMITGRRRPGQSLRANRRHMKDVHGALVLENVAVDPTQAPHRYVQNHAFDCIYGAGAGPLSIPRDFVTEVWFPDGGTAKAARESAFYLEKLKDDEANMVDDASVIGVPCFEKLISTDRTVVACPIKVFAMLSRASDSGDEAFEAIWKPATAGLGGASQHVVSRPVAKTPIGWVDSFWVADEEAGYLLADRYLAEVVEPLSRAGLLGPEGYTVVLARQYVLHAGDKQFDVRLAAEVK
ncbi:MAG TPA: EthD domain-containing protein [Ensifer sp.]|nr:EthD domain-containing protein [Ensifer sp.]